MEKSVKTEEIIYKAKLTDIMKDWNENKEKYSKLLNITLDFNEFLKFCIDKYTLLPE